MRVLAAAADDEETATEMGIEEERRHARPCLPLLFGRRKVRDSGAMRAWLEVGRNGVLHRQDARGLRHR